MIGIINYGLGNIFAIKNLYQRLDIKSKIISTVDDLENVNKLILPGVGSFDFAIEKFNNSELRDPVEELIIKTKIPVLGICVGMQIMGSNSDEGKLNGLNWISGNVSKITFEKHNLPLPHLGWNKISITKKSHLFEGINHNSYFYFLHSFVFKPKIPQYEIATFEYGLNHVCAINRENIYGVQFHPEKSHELGEKVLINFSNLK